MIGGGGAWRGPVVFALVAAGRSRDHRQPHAGARRNHCRNRHLSLPGGSCLYPVPAPPRCPGPRGPVGVGLIVNTTSVGMWPDEERRPGIRPLAPRPDQIVYDLVDTPGRPPSCAMPRWGGARVIDGLGACWRSRALQPSPAGLAGRPRWLSCVPRPQPWRNIERQSNALITGGDQPVGAGRLGNGCSGFNRTVVRGIL